MQVLIVFSCFHFLGKPHNSIIAISELFLFIQIFKLKDSLCTYHQTFNDDKLPQNPLKQIANRDQINDDDSIETAALISEKDDS